VKERDWKGKKRERKHWMIGISRKRSKALSIRFEVFLRRKSRLR